MSEHVNITINGPALCIQIDRPEKKNALTQEMYAAISEGIRRGDADSDVRAIVLHGVPGCFTSGNDLENFRNGPSSDRIYPHNLYIDALSHARKPVIAAVSGIALGIGTIMLFHCDFVYAAPQTRFSLPFVNLGLSPEGGTSYILPHLVGYQKAAEMILLGKQFDSEFAEQIGLVNEIVTEDKLLGKALETTARLAEKSPEALLAAKALLKRGTKDAMTTAMARELDVFNERLTSPDVAAAIERFFNR
ncbi:MAG: enoyl-CoA hydratase-related protein [Desulfuromonadales bacterium]|nr:enoyl-CoA hydratase-related protein [Desulfuromonadales bacterium]